ncbi:UDP-2,3-diacetamido-2,3-dideoxy-D-glucuronate 2-epimerase [Symmachiella macrocystis]|uniref:UDP-2,3-diacetamido-2,3-dideoxy-D-glucuronate 2-epimerase n=1 Tax=Symmachiella macrocystis TaxID=2527985 RepID=A0A5C6BLT5_9PLAN|nr:UDP-N-acetylglucosamine 2-epimerase (non-hydrolyzing) [Symmachiella macrocystis]TWU12637.1 UDP-2,3-diacetamido-2,3-dideoxy-D-glucuronate 2-epimerase [Symmachiella macrocystis]
MKQLSIIAGARPNFMKIAPLIRPLKDVGFATKIIHSGQHYDQKMSQTFFDELNIPHPDLNLGVGSGSHIWQISEVMRRLETEFTENPPAAVVVVGDVNSTLAAALTAVKLGIPVAHVESGLRSFDRAMPEEINRIMTDAISDWLFTSEPSAQTNLEREGVPAERIHFVGNVMIDTLLSHRQQAQALKSSRELGCGDKDYVVLTLHRPSNVDDPERLESILRAVHDISEDFPVLFPIHPRTRGQLQKFGFAERHDLNGYRMVEPQGYHSMLSLMDGARFVLTDSGGMQEETTALGVPCLTLRENTERPSTIESGSNQLVGWRTDDILAAVGRIKSSPNRSSQIPEKWDGQTSTRIAEILHRDLA